MLPILSALTSACACSQAWAAGKSAVTITANFQARLRSCELLAEAFALAPVPAERQAEPV
ncbi:hypothetical protein [Hymenobacter sp.]|uniref:hypothetical protein n=1 Tax=Hymenobacter sp. TaxID=1898978 RepID=UPI00286BEAEF|nr:hypothetical protein [Hymenobacter sp.]